MNDLIQQFSSLLVAFASMGWVSVSLSLSLPLFFFLPSFLSTNPISPPHRTHVHMHTHTHVHIHMELKSLIYIEIRLLSLSLWGKLSSMHTYFTALMTTLPWPQIPMSISKWAVNKKKEEDGWAGWQSKVTMAWLDGKTPEKQDHIDNVNSASLWDGFPVGEVYWYIT